MAESPVPALMLGLVTKGDVILDGENYGHVEDFKDIYMGALEEVIGENEA